MLIWTIVELSEYKDGLEQAEKFGDYARLSSLTSASEAVINKAKSFTLGKGGIIIATQPHKIVAQLPDSSLEEFEQYLAQMEATVGKIAVGLGMALETAKTAIEKSKKSGQFEFCEHIDSPTLDHGLDEPKNEIADKQVKEEPKPPQVPTADEAIQMQDKYISGLAQNILASMQQAQAPQAGAPALPDTAEQAQAQHQASQQPAPEQMQQAQPQAQGQQPEQEEKTELETDKSEEYDYKKDPHFKVAGLMATIKMYMPMLAELEQKNPKAFKAAMNLVDKSLKLSKSITADKKKDQNLSKGLKGDWEKEGYSIHPFSSFKEGRKFVESNPTDLNLFPEIVAGDNSAYAMKGGKIVGHIQLSNVGGKLIPIDTHVHPEHQRKGLATAMLSAMEQTTGKKIGLSDNMSESGKALFTNPNRPFGKSQLQKGAMGDWKKEGYNIKYIPGSTHYPENPKTEGFQIKAYNSSGKEVASARFEHHKDNTIYPHTVKVDPEHQRKGLATSIYLAAEKLSNKKLKSETNDSQTDQAKNLWSQPNRPFGKSQLQKGLNLPVGTLKDGKMKVKDKVTGRTYWRGVRTGLLQDQTGTAISTKKYNEQSEGNELGKDEIPGGLGDKKKLSDFDPKEVAMGRKVEMEHTNDPKEAEKIALEHLKDHPQYYTLLNLMLQMFNGDENS